MSIAIGNWTLDYEDLLATLKAYVEDKSTVRRALAVGVGTLVLIKAWQSYRFLTTFRRLGIPGPTPLPIVTHMGHLMRESFTDVLDTWMKKYGKIYGAYLSGLSLMVADKDVAREVLIKQFATFPDRTESDLFTTGAMKDSLLALKGDHWKHVRNQLSPTFSSSKLKQILPAITRVGTNLGRHLQQKAGKEEMIELRKLCRYVTMDVIAGAAFGLEVNSVDNPDDQFLKQGEGMIKGSLQRSAFFALLPFLTGICRRLGFELLPRSSLNYFFGIFDAAMDERRLDKGKHGDFLQLLVEAEKAEAGQGQVDEDIDFRADLRTSSRWTRKGLTLDEMHANSLVFMFAGYDTVSNAMSMVLFALAANQESLRKAQEEIDAKIGKGTMTYDDVMSLTYLDMFINEAIRLFVPGLIQRVASEDTTVGGYPVTKGMQVLFPVHHYHLDSEDWPDPMTFDPERFTPEEKKKRHPCSFFPFGVGPRNCIGMRLGLLEIRVIVACLLQQFTPVLCEKSVYPPVFKPVSSETRDGLWIKLQRREKVN